MSVLGRIVVAACVYYIWCERNKRLFSGEKRSYKEVKKAILNNVRFKLACLTVKESKKAADVYDQWQVPMNIRMQNESVIEQWKDKQTPD